jgi:hypothetical protein
LTDIWGQIFQLGGNIPPPYQVFILRILYQVGIFKIGKLQGIILRLTININKGMKDVKGNYQERKTWSEAALNIPPYREKSSRLGRHAPNLVHQAIY